MPAYLFSCVLIKEEKQFILSDSFYLRASEMKVVYIARFVSLKQDDLAQAGCSSIVIINSFFNDLCNFLINICVTYKSKCIFSNCPKNEVIF